MIRRDLDLARRVEALEFAFGLPRRLPLLECGECGHEVAELRKTKPVWCCPECGRRALVPVGLMLWPPSAGEGHHAAG
ncbi:MAG TPA: hypothetical protein VH392_01785 [Sphingomicrobium sp.]